MMEVARKEMEMTILKECSRRSLFWIILVLGLLCVAVDLGFLYLLNIATVKIVSLAGPYADDPGIGKLLQQAAVVLDLLRLYFIPASAGVFLIFGLILWAGLRNSFARMLRKTDALPETAPKAKKGKKPAPKAQPPVEDKAERERREKRIFLHLLSVLQREGRLIDFFAEDMDAFEDDQIGAAVRTIHENSKKGMEKYLKTEPVVSEGEDEEIEVPPDFDPNAIKLTGNVSGDPPFKGVVRHRGWRAKKLDLPALSTVRDPLIIAPAEVEIV